MCHILKQKADPEVGAREGARSFRSIRRRRGGTGRCLWRDWSDDRSCTCGSGDPDPAEIHRWISCDGHPVHDRAHSADHHQVADCVSWFHLPRSSNSALELVRLYILHLIIDFDK